MADTDDDYVYDEASGEWVQASDATPEPAADGGTEVRDSVGNLLVERRPA